MIGQLCSELLKLGSTRTGLGLFLAMLGLVALVVGLHALALPIDTLAAGSGQLQVLVQGQRIASLFAGLLGALSITGEFRHGTIRPTLLATPRRGRVMAAKVWAGVLVGIPCGLAAAVVAAGVGIASLAARGLEIGLDGGTYALLIAGGTAASALWAAIGVGFGAVMRRQVPTVVVLCIWLLFFEGLLFGDLGLSDVGRFLPGALAMAVAGGGQPLLGPGLALLLLTLYAVVAASAGSILMSRRDVA